MSVADKARGDIIDAKANAFARYSQKMLIAPMIGKRRLSKLQFIELYDSRRREGAPAIRLNSLGNCSLEQNVNEDVALSASGRTDAVPSKAGAIAD